MQLCSITATSAGETELRVYEIDHSAASLDLKPKADGLAVNPRSVRAPEIVRKFSDGIALRNFQLLTAGSPTPASAATAAVPPRASTMSSTELSMPNTSSPIVNLSRLHVPLMDIGKKFHRNKGMDSPRDIGRRLTLWLDAEIQLARKGSNSIKSAADLCRLIGISETAWSQYKKGKSGSQDRPITIEVADQLCHHFSLSLDWIYRNDPRVIDLQLLLKIQEIEKNEKSGVGVERRRTRSMREPAKAVAERRRKTSGT